MLNKYMQNRIIVFFPELLFSVEIYSTRSSHSAFPIGDNTSKRNYEIAVVMLRRRLIFPD
jgi:hypothetical protein